MKKTFRSYVALIVMFCMLISMVQPTYSASSDAQSHWAANELNSWVNQNLIQGYADGSLHPDANITRAEFITFINRVLNLTEKSNQTFPDVKASEWYEDSISKAFNAGIIEGDSNGYMHPIAPITRQEAAVIVSRAFKLEGDANAANTFKDSSQIAAWAKASIGAMKSNGYLAGRNGNRLAPVDKITRAETVKMINNVMGELISAKGTYSGDKAGNLVVNTKDIVLSNMSVKGNLYLTPGIGDGDITLHNVKVAGTTFVEGGGPNSIKVESSSLGKLAINKKNGHVRVAFDKGSSAASVQISSGAILENNSETAISNVTITDNVDGSQTVTVRGNVGKLTIEGKTKVVLASGTISELIAAENSAGSVITVEEGASVANLTLNAAINVAGTGKIENATINAQGSTLAQKPNHITVKDGVTVEVAGHEEGTTKTPQQPTPAPITTPAPSNGGGGGDTNPPTEKAPLLTFPVLSDAHIGIEDVSVDSEAKFTQALQVYKNLANYDAIVVNGDLADRGTIEQYNTAMNILNEKKVSGAKSIIAPGNHEYYAREEFNGDKFKAAERFYEKTGMNTEGYHVEAVDKNTEKSGVFFDTWVKGYHFIVMYHDRSVMSDDKYRWLEEKISKDEQGNNADPAKPVFIFSHYPYKDTTYGSESAGWNNPAQYSKFKAIMTKHQNATLFTGHTHYTLEHPNTINADDGFIRINDSAVAFVQAHGYSNDGDIYLDKNMSQGLLVKVYDDKLVIERRELDNNGAVIGAPYVIDLKNPVASAKKYSTDIKNPEFNSGANLAVSSVTAVSASFNWPKAIDDTKVDFYEINVNNKLIGAPLVISPYVEERNHTFIARGLTPNTDYTVSIKAHDAFGKVSSPISATFRTSNAPEGYDAQKADVLDMDFTNVNGKNVLDSTLNKNDAILENNAKVVNDGKFNKKALVLDAAGKRGKPSSVARVKYNSSMFKQDAMTIETAFYISPDSDLSKDEYHILGNYEDGGYYLYYSAKDKRFVFDIRNSDDPAESDVIQDVKGKIFYLTAVYDGDAAHGYANGSIKLYVNGVLAGSNTASDPLPINETNDLIIGGDVEGYGDVIHLFEGAIDHVKIYSRALGAKEITADFNKFNGIAAIKGGHDIVLFKDEIAWFDVSMPKFILQDDEAIWDIPEKNKIIKEDDDHGNKRAIKALAPGVETITVTVGDQTDTANVIVANYNVKLTLNSKINKVVDLAPIMASGSTGTNWQSLSPGVASVNPSGVVTALKVGNTVVTATVNGQTVRTRVIVDPDPNSFEPLPAIDISKRPTTAQTVKPNLTAAKVGKVLQKQVTKYARSDAALPGSVKQYMNDGIAPSDKVIPVLTGSLPGEILPIAASKIKFSVIDDAGTTWLASTEGVIRINKSEAYSRDVVQYFASHRYLPDDNVQFILPDGNNGIWAVTATGVSHIEMIMMGYEDKAQIMSDNLQKNNQRRDSLGNSTLPFLSEGYRDSQGNYRSDEKDNDGLWTADAIAGEMFRTAVEEAKDPNSAQSIEARARATKSVEADLLLMYVTGRAGKIDTKVKMAPRSTMDMSTMEYAYLKAGGNKDNPDDYIFMGPAATVKRTVQGFISRTMGIDKPGFDQHTSWNGIYYKKDLSIDGKSYSRNTTNTLTDPANTGNSDVRKKGWGELAGSVVNSANAIPARLAKLYTDLGATEQDLYYKGDTSADEILGHMYLYKIAYDTLGITGSKADTELAKLIANAAGDFARHIIDNGYTITDLTGQSTSHGKYSGDSMGQTEDAGEDTPLRAAELMAIFKTAAYVTGNQSFLDEYRKVARDYIYPSVFEDEDAYQDVVDGINGKGPLAGQAALNGVVMPSQNGTATGYMNRLNQRWASYFYASRRDGDPHPFTWYNYSDERQAMFTFYSLLSIPDKSEDQDIAVMIRAGVDNWYNANMKYENEPLWDYIYQLAYPTEQKIDLNKDAWVLKRTPIDRTDYAINMTNRTDISWFVTKAIVDADDGYNSKVSAGDLIIGGLPAENGIVYNPGTKQYTKKAVKEGDLFVARTRRQENRRVQTAEKDDPTTKIAVSPDERPRTRPGDSMFVINSSDNEGAWDYGNAYNAPYWMARYHGMIAGDTNGSKVYPTEINLPIPAFAEMVVGDSRVLDVIFKSGHDDLSNPSQFKIVTEKDLTWSITGTGKATVDPYGRLKAIKAGNVVIEARTKANPSVFATASINIVDQPTIVDGVNRNPIVNFLGTPVTAGETLQKYVDRYTAVYVASAASGIPDDVVHASKENTVKQDQVQQDLATWNIVTYKAATYVTRTDKDASSENRDHIQYFMGDRYMPSGTPQYISTDDNNGIWVVSDTGNVNRIRLENVSYAEKAVEMSDNSQQFIARHGIVSKADLINNQWVSNVQDNDGLWTSMYGGGELMRYATLKRDLAEHINGVDQAAVDATKAVAINSLKAVLLIANISGRSGEVDAKIHYLTSTRDENSDTKGGNQNSEAYLLSGKTFAVNSYPGSPADYTGFNGNKGTTEQLGYSTWDQSDGAQPPTTTNTFDLLPTNPIDWSTAGPAATTKRTMKGFIARTFVIQGSAPDTYPDGSQKHTSGLQIERSQYGFTADGNKATALSANQATGTQKVMRDGKRIKVKDNTILNIGNEPIPAVLMDLLKKENSNDYYTLDNVEYKADTSTDEFIGHLFIYKLAFDILDDSDANEHALKELIKTTVKNYAQHLIDNGYSMMDATGQGTSWGKTNRYYFESDFTIEDSPLNSLVSLNALKLAYYVSGEKKFQDEYLMLLNNPSYKFGDLAEKYWDHWMWLTQNEDYEASEGTIRLDATATEAEKTRQAMHNLNTSDEEMAMLAYYLLFQMEDNSSILAKYKNGLNGWWHSISVGENPLWYLIYQLAYPGEKKSDANGRDLITNAVWQLKRHPVDTIKWRAYIQDSRADIMDDKGLSVDPSTPGANSDPEKMALKALPADERALSKYNKSALESISENYDPKQMEGSTTYTLPYWLGRYHRMIAAD